MTRRLPKIEPSLFLYLLLGVVFILSVASIICSNEGWRSMSNKIAGNKFGLSSSRIVTKPLSTTVPNLSLTPKATPMPLTFAEMNALFGPCVHLPVLFYHHIQSREAAVANKQTALTVYTDIFRNQMEYLKSHGYNVIGMDRLISFFDNGSEIPPRSVLLTFDDAYQDLYTDAYPILQSVGFHATVFVPTGLIGNPDYLTWNEIANMNGPILFANHTWSHANVAVGAQKMRFEIATADSQLAELGLNSQKIFAYPYGVDSSQAESYLSRLGYKAAFTTVPGSFLCKKQRFNLPRIRIGNVNLSYYDF